MGQYIRRAIVGAILGSCSALLFIWYSAAHSHHPQGEFVAGLREFGRVFRRERATAHEIGKNHQLVKEAFRDVIAEANEATVSVWVNNKQVALGTVVSAHGLVLTKLSELEGGLQVKVGSERYRATVWRRIRDLDLALVQVEAAPKLQPVTFAPDPQTPQVGSLVAAPGGLAELPLALGIVSSAEHSILRELALLGVLPVDDPEGVRVDSVENGSSADRLGINENDIISKVGSESIRSAEHLLTVIRSFSAGDDVELLIRLADD
ncbi:MAG: PDZ domain-containing protein [Planctomycetota bacterium]